MPQHSAAAFHDEGEVAYPGAQPPAGGRASWLDRPAAPASGGSLAREWLDRPAAPASGGSLARELQQDRARMPQPQAPDGRGLARPAAQRTRGGKVLHIREVPSQAEACAQVVVDHLLKNRPEAAAEHLDAEVGKLARTSCKAFYHSLIHSCGLLGSPRSAMWCAVQMVRMGLKPNIVTFNSLIDTCAKRRNLGLAMEVFDIMSDTGVPPNLITYNTLINCCSQASDAESANAWLEKMLADNFSPDTVTFGAMVSLCARTGDVEGAEAWLRRMSQSGAMPDRLIFNSVISACARAGLPAKAEQWIMQMQARHWRPDEKTFSSVIQACTKAGEIERAEYWLERMLEEGFSPDKMTFRSVVQVCGKGARGARAMYWLDSMASFNISLDPASFNTILVALATAGDMSGAAQWLMKMTEVQGAPYRTSFVRIIEAASSMQDMDAAESWTQEMVKARMHPDSSTLHLLSEAASRTACAQEQRLAWALGVIILAYVHVGELESAAEWRRSAADSGMDRCCSLFDSILSSGGSMRQMPRPRADAAAAAGPSLGRPPAAVHGGGRSLGAGQAPRCSEGATRSADALRGFLKAQPGSPKEPFVRREFGRPSCGTIDEVFAIVESQQLVGLTSVVSL